MTISHVCKNHQMTQTKFINYLQGFHIIAISENTSKCNVKFGCCNDHGKEIESEALQGRD